MNLLLKHLTKQMIYTFFSVTLLLLLIVWLSQSLQFVEYIVNRGVSVKIFLELTSLLMPRFLVLIIPISTFLVTLFLYNRFNQDRELVIMQAVGMSIRERSVPAIYFGIFASVCVLVLNFWGVPKSSLFFRNLQLELRYKVSKVALQVGRFNVLTDTLVVYVKDVDSKGYMTGLFIANTKEPRKPVYYTAEHGILVAGEDYVKLVAMNGTAQFIDKVKHSVRSAHFKEFVFDTSSLESGDISHRRHALREYSTLDVYKGVRDKNNPQRLRFIAELNQRIITVLGPLTFSLLAVTFMVVTGFKRRGKMLDIIGAVVVMIIGLSLTLTLMNKASAGKDILWIYLFDGLNIASFLILWIILWISDSLGRMEST